MDDWGSGFPSGADLNGNGSFDPGDGTAAQRQGILQDRRKGEILQDRGRYHDHRLCRRGDHRDLREFRVDHRHRHRDVD